jgi:hypothetical protein
MDESESRFESCRYVASCSVFPSSALILCLTRAENESGCGGSLCRERSASIALPSGGEFSSGAAGRMSGKRGIGGTTGMASSSYPRKPVCVRESSFGLKFSSSSWIAGSTTDSFLARTGDALSESCE